MPTSGWIAAPPPKEKSSKSGVGSAYRWTDVFVKRRAWFPGIPADKERKGRSHSGLAFVVLNVQPRDTKIAEEPEINHR